MKDKKKIAAIAAVSNYIKSQQEQRAWSPPHALQEPAMGVEAVAPVPPPAAQQVIPNVWGLGGRAQQMNMRCLMQMKSFHRSKPMA